jgi:hypothetical protein
MSVGYSIPITLGVANGVTIIADALAGSQGFDTTQEITLSYSYARNPPPGFPLADAGSRALLDGPRTIAEGTTLFVYACEGIALVNAGVATAN